MSFVDDTVGPLAWTAIDVVTAGLLAKRGLSVIVLERRHKVGGAAVTEEPWGSDYKMSALSYVVSLISPAIVLRSSPYLAKGVMSM